ncbi:HEAT repeat-containing protein 4 [Tiliqua scincoides]|uniref:HEAT repeat-containing protein 4 n=1 Tax=Tiliqua scincoides TaxID=71010 RepID=UPI003461CC93
MEIPVYFKSKNPFPLESSLKITADRKNLPSCNAVKSAMTAEMPLTYQRDVCHSSNYYALYQKKCLKNMAKDLHFSKDVVRHRGPSTLSFKDYDQTGLYDFSSVIHRQKHEQVIVKREKRPRKLKPLKIQPMKSDVAPAKQTPTNVPFCLEECIWKAKMESTLAEPSLLVPVPPPPPCDPPHSQTFLTQLPDFMLGDLMTPKSGSKRKSQSTEIPESERKDPRWEEIMLLKLSKATAQWIVNNQATWGGWVQAKPKGFKKQKYDWNRIRYVLPVDSDVELLDKILAEEVTAPRIYEDNETETLLPSYYRVPSFHTIVQCIDDPVCNNTTADQISEKTFRLASPIKRRERLNSRVGKYSYTTSNVFEQELYFGTAKIVHQKSKKNHIVMDNHDEYRKHLCQHYPRPPETWSFRPQKRTIGSPQKVQKGAIPWIALPTIIENFAQLTKADVVIPQRRKRVSFQMSEKDLSLDLRIRKTMLEQWKTAWKLAPRWQAATIEGLMRDLTDIQVQNRLKAVVICASAVLERPDPVKESSEDSVIGLEADARRLEIQDIPEKIDPLLRNTLSDKDSHVRMAAAVCYYAIGKQNEVAQAIMKHALINGNAADNWAAAQALGMEGIASFQVVKTILSQIFDQKDDAREEQACLLLSQLSKQTALVQCLLASELNSYQWKNRVLACKVFSRIPGSVSKDVKNKIVQLMWTDWKFDVRQAAAKALGHLQLGKEVHNQLRERLKRGDCQMRVDALSYIGWLKLMTAKLLPDFLQCFSDDFVAVRKEACWAAGALKIKDETVLKCLFKIMQTDPLWKIKALAIRALGLIGQASPRLKELLLWALHYEDDPGVRREACRSIITLKMQDETVRATLLERMILEPNELVKEEVNRAVTVFHFEQEEEHEMIQKIKDKIIALSTKDLIIEKLLKLQEIIERTWHEAHRIYREEGDIFAYREILEIFLDVVKATFTDQTRCPSRKFSKLWKEIISLLPRLGISPSPWTQKAFSEALKAHYAEKEAHAKKLKSLAEKQKGSEIVNNSEETLLVVGAEQ